MTFKRRILCVFSYNNDEFFLLGTFEILQTHKSTDTVFLNLEKLCLFGRIRVKSGRNGLETKGNWCHWITAERVQIKKQKISSSYNNYKKVIII